MHTSSVDLLLEYDVTHPAHFLLNIEAAFDPFHRVTTERLTVAPSVKVRSFKDDRTGNRFVRLDAPRGLLTLSYHADVELMVLPVPLHLDEALVSSVPDEVLHYLLPSRYCESDHLSRVAQQLFGELPHGLSRVRAIEAWIFESVQYLPGASNSLTTAQDTFIQRMGVCRDFAHLGIAFCRALNIPARLVVGYVNFEDPPQDFHAVFEAWLDQQWVLFDATRLAPTSRLVRVGTGRDAKDVAFATIFGGVQMVRKELRVLEGDTAAPGSRDSTPSGSPFGGQASALSAAPAPTF